MSCLSCSNNSTGPSGLDMTAAAPAAIAQRRSSMRGKFNIAKTGACRLVLGYYAAKNSPSPSMHRIPTELRRRYESVH